MSANRQQGSYLVIFLVAFTALPAGLVLLPSHSALGGLLVIAGLGLLACSLAGYHRIKGMELNDKS